jgi:choline dehydrogenase
MFRCRGVETLNDVANSWPKRVRAFLQYELTHSGAIAESVFRAGAFFSSSQAELGWPDAQIHLALMSFDRPDLGPHPFPGISLSACLLHPRSRGRIAIRSADPLAPPAIDAGYLQDGADVATALELLKKLRVIAATKPFASIIDSAYEQPGPDVCDAELTKWIRAKALSIYHPVGTCAMGPASHQGAVVDARLRVHGVDGLRVVDASIMPTIVSGNTNAPVIMIGEHAASMILEDWRA